MKKVYFLTDGVVERERNWGSKIDSIVENVLKKQDYEFYSFYLTKELDKLGKPTFINDSPKINIVSIRLNLAKKFFSWILNLFSVFHFFEKKIFNSYLKNFDKPDLVVCMNSLAGYMISDIKCKKIIFVGQRQKNLYRTMIYNKLKENIFSGIYFLIKNIGFYLLSDISNINLYNKFNKVFFWSYYDFNIFKNKDKKNIFSYIENPVLDIKVKKNNNLNYESNNFFYKEKLSEKNKFNLIIVGHLRATHQKEGLFYFFSQVRKELLKIDLWEKLNIFIVGKFEPENYLKKISNYKNVFYTGFVDDLNFFYRKTDCNLLISTPDLGNRSRIADFWINQTPIVARLKTSHYPQIIDNYNGLIADTPKLIASKIKEVTTNQHLKKKIKINGFNTAMSCFKLSDFQNKIKKTIQNL
jgi:hypothetical protein